jgi:uncharacterized protein (DUF58 family)
VLTSRGRLALALGAVLYVAAWAFGAVPLYPVAVGLVLAAGLARTWIQLAGRPMQLRRGSWGGSERTEGEDVPVDLELVYEGRLLPSAVTVTDRVDRLGQREVVLSRRPERRLVGRYVVSNLPRGRYRFEETRVVLEDPFGLASARLSLASPGALLVYPRLVELGELFTETGSQRLDGRRLLLRRASGFDLHSVREWLEGESLRTVHWPSTAHRGRLMVKELEDAPRDEIAVLLDAAEGTSVGEAPESSFEAQVRAAGSLLWAHARRGRRAALVVNSRSVESHGIGADDSGLRGALEVLAGVEPNGRFPASALLAEEASRAARALEVIVVTARLPVDLVERLAARSGRGLAASLVYVDAASWNGGASAREPGLLRLQAAGVPVAVVRRGDDLARVLAGPRATVESGAKPERRWEHVVGA